MQNNKVYKVGIIGAGKIVENSHLPVLKNIDNISVEWIYDIDKKRTDLLSEMYKIAPVITNNLEEEISKIDICVITIPYGVRMPYLQAASRFKKSVYVEKPFALSVQEHIDISSMFNANEIAIGFQRRCYKIAHELKEIIQSGIFGSLKNIDFKQGYFSIKGGKGYLSDVNLSGGGVIIESAIHSFDQILNFTAATDVEVDNLSFIQKNGIDYDTTVQSYLTTPLGKIPVTSQVSTLRNLNNGLTLSFDHATIKCKLSPDAIINVFSKNGKQFSIENLFNLQNYPKTVNSSFFLFWEKFIESLNKKTENFTSASTSLLTTKWMENIYVTISQ